ncbi:Alanine racemase, biosynthetic [Afipia felis]|uniref:Alanine racemase n=1 Tax=Afipia felis TaxID=1035 RepID=A0A090MRG5_AFIFE|nr:alanine racemase [Afipia felis]CEG09970.1 Alanine racemase, biosynthetic [Afipia felis]
MEKNGRFRGGTLAVDLRAVRSNYRLLRSRLRASTLCAGVVKADGYGLGATYVSRALFAEGCRHFFVAHLDEGLALRPYLPRSAAIFILNGLPRGAERECAAAGLVPVLNSPEQAGAWAGCARTRGQRLPAVLQVDSGMNRLGLTAGEAARFAETPARSGVVDLRYIMSHLACADTPAHEANAMQLATFRQLAGLFPDVPRSLANSSGIFLGPDYHFSLVRPGSALYGVNPDPAATNPMQSVVRLTAKVIQLRNVMPGDCVGYGWDARARGEARLATLSLGYADGFHRAWGKGGAVFFEGLRLPVVGRVSMDSIVIDASAIAPGRLGPDSEVEVIGDDQPLDDLASVADTIGYEVLTGLGSRYQRIYLGAEESVPSAMLEDSLQ